MPRIKHAKKGDIRLLIVAEDRLVDDLAFQEIHRDLNELLDSTEEKQLVLDLGRVDFVASAALGMLVRIRKRCVERKLTLKICNVGPAIDEAFQITGLHALFEIYDTLEQAIESFESK